ncbi:MAG: SCP2 sterol-binding domain-containing protein [Ilumatobacteraceae bacterium]
MSHQFLSDDWIEAARDIRRRWEDRVPAVEMQVRINVVATKVPFGEGTVHAHIDSSSGRLEMELGLLDAADLTVTTDYDTARQLFVAQDPAASMQAFMSGKIKVEGDITKLMLMQTSVPQTDDAMQVAEEIRRITA